MKQNAVNDSPAELDPEVASIIADVADDFRMRLARGETPNPDDYAARYPLAADEIRGVLAVVRLAFASSSEAEAIDSKQTVDQSSTGPDSRRRSDKGERRQPPAELIGGFEIISELGRGGMGVVYQARQIRLKRLVALKMIRAGSYADDGELARFRLEAEAIARLQHPNIVQVYEVGEHGGQPFCVLEYVSGGTLATKLASAPQPQREPLRRGSARSSREREIRF